MKIFILGGTRFLGRHIAEALVKRDHDVTLFHRGRTSPLGVPGARNVVGDRDLALDDPEQAYDAVVDTCGFFPRQVESSTSYFKKNSPNSGYLFVSSVSAYDDRLQPESDEYAALWPGDRAQGEEMTPESYGALKAACERVVMREYKSRALIIRPGLIVGPLDRTDRFTYWVRRLWLGGDVLAPGNPARRVQLIDARDLADWIVTLLERGAEGGVFNATGPGYPLMFGELIAQCATVARSTHALHWAGERFLLDAGVQPWTELPLWLPADEGAAFDSISSARAQGNGLTYRPIETTIADTLEWDRSRGLPALVSGISSQRESELISALLLATALSNHAPG